MGLYDVDFFSLTQNQADSVDDVVEEGLNISDSDLIKVGALTELEI